MESSQTPCISVCSTATEREPGGFQNACTPAARRPGRGWGRGTCFLPFQVSGGGLQSLARAPPLHRSDPWSFTTSPFPLLPTLLHPNEDPCEHTGPAPHARIIFQSKGQLIPRKVPCATLNLLGQASCSHPRIRMWACPGGPYSATTPPQPLHPAPRETARPTRLVMQAGVFSPNLADDGVSHQILGTARVATPRAEEPVGMGTAERADR